MSPAYIIVNDIKVSKQTNGIYITYTWSQRDRFYTYKSVFTMSRPSTPKRRRSQRSSGVYNILSQSPKVHYPVDLENLPLESQANTEKFEKLSDSMEELDSNMDNLQKIQESLSTEFNESFASFLYGLLMTMWCVHFPGRPTREQWDKIKLLEVVDGRIAEIKEKLKVSQEENESLRKRLEGNVKKKINFADEATSDSFIMNPASRNAGATNGSKVTKIPLRNARRGVGSGSSQLTEPGLGPGGPNLNQPPRYMRGLFDSTNTRISSANRRQYRDQRPPFR